MPFSYNPAMMREIIMDHYQNPRNKRETNDPTYQTIYMDSTSCIDKIHVQAKVENNILTDVCWHGIGCAIATSSTSIMSELLIGKTVDEANLIIENYLKMINEEKFDADLLDEAIVFINTSKQAARIKCATIGWRGVKKILKGDENNG